MHQKSLRPHPSERSIVDILVFPSRVIATRIEHDPFLSLVPQLQRHAEMRKNSGLPVLTVVMFGLLSLVRC